MHDPTAGTGRLIARYRIESAADPDVTAREIAGEQSTGTFVRVPGQSEAGDQRYGATVDDVQIIRRDAAPSLYSRTLHAGTVTVADIQISWPAPNTSTLSACMAAAAGNLSELASLTAVRLLDVRFPDTILATLPRPRHGIPGTRALASVADRPLFGTIVKPSVGLSSEDTARLVYDVASAGLDFIKDDELMLDPDYNPLEARTQTVERALDQAERTTGRRAIFAYNITADSTSQLLANAELVRRRGGRCVMVNLNGVGFAAVRELRAATDLAIHGHRAGWGMFTRSPAIGFSFSAYQSFWRLCGIDHLHTSGLASKFWESDDSVLDSIRAVQTRLRTDVDDRALPVLSSGQTASHVYKTAAALGNADFLLLAGGGILAHPDGPRAGVQSMHEAWSAYRSGADLVDFARTHPALGDALRAFGNHHRERSTT